MSKVQRYNSASLLWGRGILVSLSIFMAGYNLGIVNTLGARLVMNFNWTDQQQTTNLSLVSSMLTLAIIFGPILSIDMRKLGRFKAILLINVVSDLGLILCCVVNFPVLLFGRFLIGMAVGLAYSAAPLYIGELTPMEKRSTLTSIPGIALTLGLLVSFLVGLNDGINDPNDNVSWRVAFFIPLLVNMVQIVVMPWLLVESPRFYIMSKNDEEAAMKNLQKIFKEDFVQEELESLKKEKMALQPNVKVFAFLREYWRPLLVAIDVAMINQLSGISPLNFFSNQLFLKSGLSMAQAQLYTIITGIINILGSFTTFYLVKKFTPKKNLHDRSLPPYHQPCRNCGHNHVRRLGHHPLPPHYLLLRVFRIPRLYSIYPHTLPSSRHGLQYRFLLQRHSVLRHRIHLPIHQRLFNRTFGSLPDLRWLLRYEYTPPHLRTPRNSRQDSRRSHALLPEESCSSQKSSFRANACPCHHLHWASNFRTYHHFRRFWHSYS